MLQRQPAPARAALFCVGHDAYWPQFEGLLDTLMGYHAQLREKIAAQGVEVVDLGMVDSSEGAFAAAARIAAEAPDVIFCNMITYATSMTFAPIIQSASAPIVLVALQPLAAMDYSRANTRMQLENDNVCSVPEFTGVAIRMGKRVADVILGVLEGDREADDQIQAWCAIARALRALKGARVGLMGHVLEAMYDMHADPTAISAAFGVHVPLLEMDELAARYQDVGEEAISAYEGHILATFDTPDPLSDPLTEKLTATDLREAARAAAALEGFVTDNRLSGLAYYHQGQPGSLSRHVASSLIVGNSLLIAQGFPMCGEFDIKTCLAMLIMDRLGIGGSFAEFHPFDFREDFILVGHDGPHHLLISQGRPVLRSLKQYHGKPGRGASVEFKIKEGPITMLGITQTASGGFKFVIGQGLSKQGPIPPTGNTNTRGFFAPTTKAFVKRWVMEGPTHHYALGIGHHADTLAKLADALGVEHVIVG